MIKLIHSSILTLTIAIIGLFGRSILDKILAAKGGAQLVADWAQILSITELFIGPIGAGLGIGLTALISRTDCQFVKGDILHEAWQAFKYSIFISFIIVLSLGIAYAVYKDNDQVIYQVIAIACITGITGSYLSFLNAWWAGQQQPFQILIYITMNNLLIVICAWLSHHESMIFNLITIQAFMTVVILVPKLNNQLQTRVTSRLKEFKYKREIDSYLIAGMVIGLMSPLSLLLIREQLNIFGPIDSAGIIQSTWRVSEWIATPAATILTIYFLPIFSKVADQPLVLKDKVKLAFITILPASLLLYLVLYVWRESIWSNLYNINFIVSYEVILFFFVGDCLRIWSWIYLFYFYATRSIKTIVYGEFLSLPLFCTLLYFNRDSLDYSTIGLLYLFSYLLYLLFNYSMYVKLNFSASRMRGKYLDHQPPS